MPIKSQENSLAAWSFLIGVVLAIIIGLSTSMISVPFLTTYSAQIYAILVILGLLVGFSINVSGRKDSETFLIISAILVIVSRFGMESVRGSLIGIGIGNAVSSTFAALLALFVPATIIVAIKSLFNLTQI